MKKVSSIILVAMLLVAMSMCLTACSPNGTYNFVSMTMDTGLMKVEIEADKEFSLVPGTPGVTIKKEAISLVINKDKTFEMKVDTTAMGSTGTVETTKGTWEKKDGKLLLTDEVSKLQAKL